MADKDMALAVPPSKLTQFSSRLRKFTREGLCKDLVKGRGIAIRYSPRDVRAFYVAAALNLVGVAPGVAVQKAERLRRNDLPAQQWRFHLPLAYGNASASIAVNIPSQLLEGER